MFLLGKGNSVNQLPSEEAISIDAREELRGSVTISSSTPMSQCTPDHRSLAATITGHPKGRVSTVVVGGLLGLRKPWSYVI